MQEIKNKFYVTTPIYYVTAKPHLGSLYSTLLADVVARWQKLQGKKVFFLTGTDEHGQKVAEAAEKAGQKPQAFVDGFIHAYKSMWDKYEIAYNYFVRTTDPQHIKAVQQWLTMLQEKGDIYKDTYKGWYCTNCETYLTDKEAENYKGDYPPCPTCGRATHILAEDTYFFRLSAYQDRLLAFYKENPNFIVPKERTQEVINFVKGGLKDLSISRTTINWGIPFANDSQHVAYVWADALNNYITAVGYAQPGREKEFDFWWPADLQIMGKDIVRFHAIYWPAFLMASNLALPKQLLVHGWIKVNNQKMSKSLGNAVDPQLLFDAYGPEPVRYYLVKHMAINQDGEFSIEDLEQKITSDLANDLGNLLNRMTSLAHKNNIYEIAPPDVWSQKSIDLRDASLNMLQDVHIYMADYQFHMALAQVFKFIHATNIYFHEQEPWKLAQKDLGLFMEVISATCHALKSIAIVLSPVMPNKMKQLWQSLGLEINLEEDTLHSLQLVVWQDRFMLHKIDPLFVKPEPKEQAAQTVLEIKNAEADQVAPIGIEDFVKMQLAVGTIEQAEEVAGSDKLLKLQVDFGPLGKRQILSGVKKSYAPQDLVGKQGVYILNLKPRKMMGLESHGMMLFADAGEGKVKLVTTSENVPNGALVK